MANSYATSKHFSILVKLQNCSNTEKSVLHVVIPRSFLLCESNKKQGLRFPFLLKFGITATVSCNKYQTALTAYLRNINNISWKRFPVGSHSFMRIFQFFIYINVTIINFSSSWQLINTLEIVFTEKYIYFVSFKEDVIYVCQMTSIWKLFWELTSTLKIMHYMRNAK